jgi:WD40 repeat protein
MKVWDLETGRAIYTLGRSINGVAVTLDGRRAVSTASWDKTMTVWDLETGSALRNLKGHSYWVGRKAVTPDGRRAVSATIDKTLETWDLETGAMIATFTCDAVVECCACIDAHKILAGDAGGQMYWLELME